MPASFNRKPKTENRKPPASPLGLPLVAIIGRANVGKSTLFNRLTQSSRALVADIPGVTRDRHYGSVSLRGPHLYAGGHRRPGGGARARSDPELGEQVRRQAEAAVAEADVILLVMDGRAGPQEDDGEVVDYLRRTGKPVLLVVNKMDHPRLEGQAGGFLPLRPGPRLPGVRGPRPGGGRPAGGPGGPASRNPARRPPRPRGSGWPSWAGPTWASPPSSTASWGKSGSW